MEHLLAVGNEVLQLQVTLSDAHGARGEDDAIRALALLRVGVAEHWIGNLDAADGHLADATAIAQRLDLAGLLVEALGALAQTSVSRARLTSATKLALRATELAAANGWLKNHRAAGAHLALGAVCLERHELDDAERHVEAARAACLQEPGSPLPLGIAIVHAWLCQARGDPAGGHALLTAARHEVAGPSTPL